MLELAVAEVVPVHGLLDLVVAATDDSVAGVDPAEVLPPGGESVTTR